MTIDCVLDTSALLAYLRDEPGADKVATSLEGDECVKHVVNAGEFLYSVSRRMPDRFTPESAAVWLESTAIGKSANMTMSLLVLAARIRRAVPALSFGDGMAIALASTLRVPVLTTEKAFRAAADFAAIDLIR